MPKKPHPPRNSGASKKSANPTSSGVGGGAKNDDAGSFIVFTNDTKSDGKKKSPGKRPGAEEASGSSQPSKGKSSNKNDGNAGTEQAAPKKPDLRTLIGGASWTGKLPVNMLSEHCQKQKWEKPEYSMHKEADGQFSSMVTLSQKNPKSQEVTTLPAFKLRPEYKQLAHQPTAVEARHFAAAYALFRVASGKNIHMMMPPLYRDLWKGPFQEMKDADLQDHKDWLYAADPFLAQKELEESKVQKAKLREQHEKQKAAEAAKPGGATQIFGSSSDRPHEATKWWNRASKIEMGEKSRREVESIVREYGVWNVHNVTPSRDTRIAIVKGLSRLGFRKSHVEEAAEICGDREEALEWLLIHVPEDDLPSWSLPEGYATGVSMASGNLKKEASLKRLASAGYSKELCEELYDYANENELRAGEMLQQRLLYGDSPSSPNAEPHQSQESDTWNEEREVLALIYEGRFEVVGSQAYKITLETKTERKDISLIFQKPSGPYPEVIPVMTVAASLPAYIHLSITKQALQNASQNLLGQQMIFNIVDWLENVVLEIIEEPGKLIEVAAAVSSISPEKKSSYSKRPAKKHRSTRAIDWQPGSSISMKLLSAWNARQKEPQQLKMLKARQNLPAWKLQEAIVNAVNSYQVVIISGETGSGKSTQSVQFILDDLIKNKLGGCANIICTQPRRISALGLADRVADERCSPVGQEVGYTIRGESKQTPGTTKITFVTTGVLLRRLQTSGGSIDDMVASLADVSHVVVDEVHERSLDTDFILALLRDVIKRRKDLKVILMSATLDAEVFESYFGGPKTVGRIEIQGRTYPVEDHYLDDVARITGLQESAEDDLAPTKRLGDAIRSLGTRINYDLIANLVKEIDGELDTQDGGILIFLPGTVEINRTLEALRSMPQIHALPLHASLLPSEQRRVFPPAPSGKRKVIAATNVAETSITIEDIVAVIDTGRVKETHYDAEKSMVKLEEVWASRAACKQRRGRAGRVRAGKCYKLYTKAAESKMLERPDPEIRRVPLEQLCLSVKAMGVANVSKFLANTLTPPESLAVDGGMQLLRQVGALDSDNLTALGQHMAMIPADLRCAKLMVYGALLNCLEPAVTIAAILTIKSPFVSPQDKREESKSARIAFSQNQGDVIADLCAYDEWKQLSRNQRQRDVRHWCDENFLSYQTLSDISTTRAQYIASLQEIGFLPLAYKPPSHNDRNFAQTYSYPLLHAIILSALHPQTLKIELPSQKFQSTSTGAKALDPESRAIKYFSTALIAPSVERQPNASENVASPGLSSAATRTRMFIHPSSTLFSAQSFPNSAGFLSYFTRVETSKVFVRECTPCGTFGMLLFGGGRIELDTRGRGVVLTDQIHSNIGGEDDNEADSAASSSPSPQTPTQQGGVRVPFQGWARIGVLVSRLRIILDDVLARWIEQPAQTADGPSDAEVRILDTVRRLIELEGMDR